MTEALRVVDATVHLGGRDIFCRLNATVARGEFLGVFGPNGAGKSTFLRAILGLCPLASGRTEVLGSPPASARHKIGYMPQAGRMPEGIGLSAREMVCAALHGTRPGLPICGRAGHREVDRALKLVGGVQLCAASIRSSLGRRKTTNRPRPGFARKTRNAPSRRAPCEPRSQKPKR